MKEIKGRPEERSVEKFAIRSMSKAKYSTNKEKLVLDYHLDIIRTSPHQLEDFQI